MFYLLPVILLVSSCSVAFENFQDENRVRDLELEIQKLREENTAMRTAIRYIIEHSSEIQLAMKKDEEEAQNKKQIEDARKEEIENLNRTVFLVAENGSFIQMEGGRVFVVAVGSQAYVKKWKKGDRVLRVQSRPAKEIGAQMVAREGWIMLQNISLGDKTEAYILVRVPQ